MSNIKHEIERKENQKDGQISTLKQEIATLKAQVSPSEIANKLEGASKHVRECERVCANLQA